MPNAPLPIVQRLVRDVDARDVEATRDVARILATGNVLQSMDERRFGVLEDHLAAHQLQEATRVMDVAARQLWEHWSSAQHAIVLKCQAVLGAAVMITVAGLSPSDLLRVAIMETSKIPGLQEQSTLAFFVAAREESMYQIASYRDHKKQSLEAPPSAGEEVTLLAGKHTLAGWQPVKKLPISKPS